jgi:hypothetical protein
LERAELARLQANYKAAIDRGDVGAATAIAIELMRSEKRIEALLAFIDLLLGMR